MRPTRLCIGTNVSFHASESVVAFVGPMHLKVSIATRVFGRGLGLDERCINAGALLEQPTVLSQFVFSHQMTRVQDGGVVWNATSGQRQDCKTAHRLPRLKRFCHGQIDQRESWLREVNPKHRLKHVRQTSAFALGVNRFISAQRVFSAARLNLFGSRISRAAFALRWAADSTSHKFNVVVTVSERLARLPRQFITHRVRWIRGIFQMFLRRPSCEGGSII